MVIFLKEIFDIDCKWVSNVKKKNIKKMIRGKIGVSAFNRSLKMLQRKENWNRGTWSEKNNKNAIRLLSVRIY